MMGTHEQVSEAENVPLIKFVEEEITRIAKDKKFVGVFTTNTNPLAIVSPPIDLMSPSVRLY